MRKRRPNSTEVQRLIARLEKIAQDMLDVEPEPESDDLELQDLIEQKRDLERELKRIDKAITKRKQEREDEKRTYKMLGQEYAMVERQIKKLDPEFDGL